MSPLRGGKSKKYGVSLHTDQQSLIFGELQTARNKLQEENQQLRDKLQDAEMLIRLLQLKLNEQSQSQKHHRSYSQSAKSKTRVEKVLDWKMKRLYERRKSNATTRKKNAFKNKVPPGKRTFESSKGTSEMATAHNNAVNCRGRSELLQGSATSENTDDAVEQVLERDDTSKPMNTVIGKLAQVVINEYSTAEDQEQPKF